MTNHEALEDLRRLLSDERLRRRTLAAAASGELERLTRPDEDDMTHDEQISLRLPSGLLERCDALAGTLQGNPDLAALGRVTRASVIRLALQRGLSQLEQQHQPAGSKRRG